jgi:hypothetical protein
MDESIADKLPPKGAEIPTEGAHDAAQTGLVPIIEVWPDDADSSSSSSRHQSNSPESRIELVADIEEFYTTTLCSRTPTAFWRWRCGSWVPIPGPHPAFLAPSGPIPIYKLHRCLKAPARARCWISSIWSVVIRRFSPIQLAQRSSA